MISMQKYRPYYFYYLSPPSSLGERGASMLRADNYERIIIKLRTNCII